MKVLIKIALIFSLVYLILMVHAFTYKSKQKSEAIAQWALHVKDVEPSLSFRSSAYQRFVYAK